MLLNEKLRRHNPPHLVPNNNPIHTMVDDLQTRFVHRICRCEFLTHHGHKTCLYWCDVMEDDKKQGEEDLIMELYRHVFFFRLGWGLRWYDIVVLGSGRSLLRRNLLLLLYYCLLSLKNLRRKQRNNCWVMKMCDVVKRLWNEKAVLEKGSNTYLRLLLRLVLYLLKSYVDGAVPYAGFCF